MSSNKKPKTNEAQSQKAKLYCMSFWSSSPVVQTIYELGIQDQIEFIELKKENFKQELAEINPQGTIPTYVEGNLVLVESSAIILHLLRKYDSNHQLSPKDQNSDEYSYFLQWLFYSPATLYPTSTPIMLDREEPEDTRAKAYIEKLEKKWKNQQSKFLSKEVKGKKFILGDQFSAADIALSYSLLAVSYLGLLEDPILKEYYERLSSRESFKKTYPLE